LYFLLPALLAIAAPPERMAQLLARSIGYDKNLKARAGDSLVIGLVHAAANAASTAHCAAMQKAFSALKGVRVQGVPIDVVAFPFAKTFAEDLKSRAVDVVYVCPAVAPIAEITAQTRRAKILSVAADEKDVGRGLTLGAAQDGAKITLVINQTSAKAEGVEFAEQLLSVAKIVN
jgi:hypothetical protein